MIYLMGSFLWSVVVFHENLEEAPVWNSPIMLEVPEYLPSTSFFYKNRGSGKEWLSYKKCLYLAFRHASLLRICQLDGT